MNYDYETASKWEQPLAHGLFKIVITISTTIIKVNISPFLAPNAAGAGKNAAKKQAAKDAKEAKKAETQARSVKALF